MLCSPTRTSCTRLSRSSTECPAQAQGSNMDACCRHPAKFLHFVAHAAFTWWTTARLVHQVTTTQTLHHIKYMLLRRVTQLTSLPEMSLC